MKTLSLLLAFAALDSYAAIDRSVYETVQRREPARVIVALNETSTPAIAAVSVVESLRTAADFSLIADWPRLHAFAAEIGPEALAMLESDRRVRAVSLDPPGGGAMADSAPMVGLNLVHGMGITGRNVTIAVLDSGLDLTHADFQGRIVAEQCFCRNSNGTGCCPNGAVEQSGAGAGADDHGHGTNVTGIAASGGAVAQKGMAPDAKVIVIKVLDRNNAFSGLTQVISGLEWLAANHPEARVVNMSLLTNAHFAGDCDSSAAFNAPMANVINLLRANGTAVFACAGNTASSTTMGSPACIRNAISVGAVYDSNPLPLSCDGAPVADRVTCFSDSSTTLDILAPGATIRSSGRNGSTSSFNGTSQATPHVAGAAALLLEVNPTLTVEAIESILESTGKPIVDSRNGQTFPRLDVFAAVRSAKPPARRRVLQ